MSNIVKFNDVEEKIITLRNQPVLLDSDARISGNDKSGMENVNTVKFSIPVTFLK